MTNYQPPLGFEKSYRLKDDEFIIFDHFPMPPSSNEIYRHFRDPKTKKIRRVSSNALTHYKKACQQWALVNHQLCKAANLYLRDEKYIQVDVWVAMRIERIHDANGAVKKLDVSNRGKALFDQLAEAIKIDDRHFKRTRIDKVVADSWETECCIIRLSRARLHTTKKIREFLENVAKPFNAPSIRIS